MKIYEFNIKKDKNEVINELVYVYNNHMELFEDFAYCHYNIDKDTNNIILYNYCRETEFGSFCTYETDMYDDVTEESVRKCVEYFYDRMTKMFSIITST